MPDDVESYGLLVDANVGLGNYKEAEAAAQMDARFADWQSGHQPDICELPGCGRHSETRKGRTSRPTMAFQRVSTA